MWTRDVEDQAVSALVALEPEAQRAALGRGGLILEVEDLALRIVAGDICLELRDGRVDRADEDLAHGVRRRCDREGARGPTSVVEGEGQPHLIDGGGVGLGGDVNALADLLLCQEVARLSGSAEHAGGDGIEATRVDRNLEVKVDPLGRLIRDRGGQRDRPAIDAIGVSGAARAAHGRHEERQRHSELSDPLLHAAHLKPRFERSPAQPASHGGLPASGKSAEQEFGVQPHSVSE